MRLGCSIAVKISVLIAVCLMIGLAQAQPVATPTPAVAPAAPLAPGASRVTSPAVGKTAGQTRRTGGDPVDDRVELREYLFTDTNEVLPYAVFVSTKVTKDKKAPLVLALHGMGGNHGTFMRTPCVDEAEKNGYILIGAMGYSPNGPFGMNFGMGGRGRGGPGGPGGRGAQSPSYGAAPQPEAGAARGGAGGRMGRGMMGGRGPAIGGTKETDSAKVAELSEKDAMNVLAMACKEFNVDENRIYLMGHSLGGGGALHMGDAHPSTWAGVAALAPAAFGFTWTADSKLKDVPLLIIQGDGDTMVRPEMSKQTADTMKELKFKVEYKIVPGLDHASIIGGGMPDVFKFFSEHTKSGQK
jgi:predicted esterase